MHCHNEVSAQGLGTVKPGDVLAGSVLCDWRSSLSDTEESAVDSGSSPRAEEGWTCMYSVSETEAPVT
jgi:hypothetical protein